MRTVTILAVLALAAAVAGPVGCNSIQARDWTITASQAEISVINTSEFMPVAQRLTIGQVEALGAARVAMYEKYGQMMKIGIDNISGKDKPTAATSTATPAAVTPAK